MVSDMSEIINLVHTMTNHMSQCILILGIAFGLCGCCSPQPTVHERSSNEPCVYHHDPGLKDSPGLFSFIDMMERNTFYLGMSHTDLTKILGKRLVTTHRIKDDGGEIAYVDLVGSRGSGVGQPRKDTWVARFHFDKNGKLTLYYVSNECRWKSERRDHPDQAAEK